MAAKKRKPKKPKKTPRVQPKKRLTRIHQETSTPASLIIDAHYAKLNIRKRWTSARIDRLCSFLRLTYGEMASLLGLNHNYFTQALLSTKPLSGPVCLLLTIIETHYMKGSAPDVVTNLFKFNG